MASNATPKAVVEEMYRAYAAGDMDAALATFAPDVLHVAHATNRNAAFCGTFTGHNGLLDRIQAIGAAFAFESYVPRTIIVEGERVAAMVDFAAVHRETGARFDSTIAHFIVVRDGKIVELIEFFDTAMAEASVR